jgi:hypothetical protein
MAPMGVSSIRELDVDIERVREVVSRDAIAPESRASSYRFGAQRISLYVGSLRSIGKSTPRKEAGTDFIPEIFLRVPFRA